MTTAFRYVALDGAGRRIRGVMDADNEAAAHASLGRRGLAALEIAGVRPSQRAREPRSIGHRRLNGRQVADFLFALGSLAEAGIGVRAALNVISRGYDARNPLGRAARTLEQQLAAGRPLEAAFALALGPGSEAVAGLAAAGEAYGDLGAALRRGAVALEEENRAREEITAALAYPGLILAMTLASLSVILLLVVPALEPIAQQSTAALPLGLAFVFGLSAFLRTHGALLLVGIALLATAAVVGARWGLVRKPIEGWLLDGPLAPIARGLVFGRCATLLGLLLAAQVAATDALQLTERTVRLHLARERLAACRARVREGGAVSTGLADCRGMPVSIVRLARVGEEVGQLGEMLERAGRLESRQALARLTRLSQWLGPALIVALGAIIGLIMAGLLTGITTLGDVTTST